MKKFRSGSNCFHRRLRAQPVRPGCPVTVPADPLCSRQSDERPQGFEFGHLLGIGFCLRLDALGAIAGAVATLGPSGAGAGAGATDRDPLTPSQRDPCCRCPP